MLRRPVVVIWTARAWLVAMLAVAAVAAALVVAVRTAITVSVPLSDAVCGKIIIIDPGHGGEDAGARGRSGLLEKDVVLDIARHLAGLFNRVAVYTVMTRTDGAGPRESARLGSMEAKRLDLEGRVNLAAKSGADIYISIHANSFPEPVWSGAQTFYHARSEAGRSLAVAIQRELAAGLGPNLRKAKPGNDYFVLRKSEMPAVLVEVGFLSNPREEALLAQADYRRRVAEAIFRGTVNYLVEAYKVDRAGKGQAPGAQARPASDPTPGPALPGAGPGPDPRARAAVNLAEDEVLLYFAGPTNFDDDLMPEVRKIPGLGSVPELEGRIAKILGELVAGPAGESVLCPTVPRGTRLRSVEVAGRNAHVDLSEEIVRGHWGGSRSEQLTIYSIVNTLAELPEVAGVQILIEGSERATIAGHIFLDAPLAPDYGIVESAR